MHRPEAGFFEKGSPVLEYWLANSEGFALARRPLKRRITGVVIDPATGQAHSLLVHRSFRRPPKVVAADAVTAVDVNGRLLYAAKPRRARLTTARGHAVALNSRLQPVAARAARTSAAGVSKWSRIVAAFAAKWARIAAAEVSVRLGPLASAYAHNAATIARAYVHAVRSRTLER